MSSSAKARCVAVVLSAVLLLAAVAPAQAAPLGSRGDSSGVLSALWSWLEAAWGVFVPVGVMEKQGSAIDPNGGTPPEGSAINPNGGPVESTTSDQGSAIDPNGGRP